jgi:ketosteroid isomerase-like protein
MSQLRVMLATAFVMCMGLLTFAQDATNPPASDSAGAEQQVKQLEQQVRAAVIKGDTSVLEKYLSDDYVGIAPNGQAADKSQSIQDLKNGRVKYSAIDVTEDRVRMYGDTAIYNGRANVRMSVNGQPQTGEMRATIVWVKQNGQWKRVSFQSTRVSMTGGTMQMKERE